MPCLKDGPHPAFPEPLQDAVIPDHQILMTPANQSVMRERTSIIVSHRISTVRDADVIFLLDEGRIAERGTHDELIRHNGLYAALHKKQLLEAELAAS